MWLGNFFGTVNTDPRIPTDEDFAGWMQAADARERRTARQPRTIQDIHEALNKKNSFRYWRLRHDYKWLRKQLVKMGVDPEYAKELL